MCRIRSLLVVSLCLVGFAAMAHDSDSVELLTQVEAQRLVDELLPKVEQLRGLAFKEPVPVEVVDDGAMRKYVTDRIREFDQERHIETVEQVYRLLGLIPDDAGLLELLTEALEEQAGGFYDPGRGAYYLLDDVPRSAAPIFTAHELTHALEDQYFDLDDRLRQTIADDDRSMAMSAVHEGSATILMSVYMMQAVLLGEMDADALQAIARTEAGRAEKLRALPDVLLRQLLGPYVLGATFLTRGDLMSLAGGFPAEAVNRAMKDGPRSSEQILHPEKFWDEELRDLPSTVKLKGMRKVLGKSWEQKGEGVLGELTLGTLVGAKTPLDPGVTGIPDARAWTNDAAAGWGGDRWELWEGDGRTILLLRIDWDSPDDAREFAEALPEGEKLHWRQSADRVAVVAGEVGEKTEPLLARLLR